MPRKNPIPSSELAITNRIFQLMTAKKWSMATLGREAGIDLFYLSNLKHGRAILRYRTARQLQIALRFNPHWLARGMGERVAELPLPDCDTPDYFSKVYARLLAENALVTTPHTLPDYSIFPGRLIIHKPCSLTSEDLARVLLGTFKNL